MPKHTPPSEQEITTEIKILREVKPRVRRQDVMLRDNHEKIDAEISFLENRMMGELLIWQELIDETAQWVRGEFPDPPSKKWIRDKLW